MQITPKNYVEIISGLSKAEKLRFYEALAHNLTIICRTLWADDELSKDEMLDSMKWLNEILHRVTSKTTVVRLELYEWTEADVIDMLSGYVKQSPILGSGVAWAINRSYWITLGVEPPAS